MCAALEKLILVQFLALISFVTLPILLSQIFREGSLAASSNFPGSWFETLRLQLRLVLSTHDWSEWSAWGELVNSFQILWKSRSSTPGTRHLKIDEQCPSCVTNALICNSNCCIIISMNGRVATSSTGDWLNTSASLQSLINLTSSLLLYRLQSNRHYCHFSRE